jgi:hypothetical protein
MESLLGNNQKDGKVSLPSFVTFGKSNYWKGFKDLSGIVVTNI